MQTTKPNKLETNKSRRNLLLGSAAVGGVWHKPLIKSVLLPAHAGMSAVSMMAQEFFGEDLQPSSSMTSNDRKLSPLEIFIPSAHAGNVPAEDPYTVSAIPNGEDNYDISLVRDLDGVLRLGTLEVGGSNVELALDGIPCSVPPQLIQAQIVSVGDNLILRLNSSSDLTVPPGSGIAEAAVCLDSDRRLKTKIKEVALSEQGHALYRFQYLNDPTKTDYVGVMAQDLEQNHPDTLVMGADGFYRVRYDKLGLRMATYDEWRKQGLESVTLN